MRTTNRQLKRVVRRVIQEELYRRDLLIQEGKFQDIMAWIKEKGKAAVNSTKDFLRKFKQELEETKEGALILTKIIKGEALSAEESSALTTQVKDLAKGLPLLTLLALPGGGIATVALVKLARKAGVNLMPSSFQENDK